MFHRSRPLALLAVPAILAALLLLVTACGDGGGGGAGGDAGTDSGTDAGDDFQDHDLHTVLYAGSKWPGHAPVWVGIRQGFFKDAGFTVDPRSFGGSTDRINALEADSAQFSSLGEVAMLEAMAQGRDGFYWIGSQDIAPGNEGIVAVGVDSLEDLAGKRIAVTINSSVHLTVALLLEQAGLDINEDVEIVKANDSQVVDLVRGGDCAAGAIWEPFYSELRGLDGARVLGTDMDTSIYKEFQTMTGPDVICVSREWYDADPERARNLLRAYWRAVEWCRDNPDALLDVIAEETGKQDPEGRAELERTMENFIWLGWEGQKVVMSDRRMFGQAEAACEVLKDMGLIEQTPDFRAWTRPDVFE